LWHRALSKAKPADSDASDDAEKKFPGDPAEATLVAINEGPVCCCVDGAAGAAAAEDEGDRAIAVIDDDEAETPAALAPPVL